MKYLALVTIGLIGCVGCASSSTPGPALSALAQETIRDASVEKETAEQLSPTLNKAESDAPDGHLSPVEDETLASNLTNQAYLEKLCLGEDFDAARVHWKTVERRVESPNLLLCVGEAFLRSDATAVAIQTLAPLVARGDQAGVLARDLLSRHYERLGRWELIRALYEDRDLSLDPRGLRNLGVAYRQTSETARLDALLPAERPKSSEPWRWLWWLREFEQGRIPSAIALRALVNELPTTAQYELKYLRPLVTQAHRRAEWLDAAQRCSAGNTTEETEIRALRMSRTSVSAALKGDVDVWETALNCALKLAQVTANPEDTCQEIHQEQMDWETEKKLGATIERYPSQGSCGRQSESVRNWLERWSNQPRGEGAS